MAMTKPLSIQLWNVLKSEFKHSSTNLAIFAKSKKYLDLKNYYRVYKDSEGDLHLGFIDDAGMLCGRYLIRLACGDKATFAYSISNPIDVTEWFIEEYKNKGMCAYTDMRHEWNLEDGHVGSSRFCIHCNKVETKRSKLIEKTWWE